MGAGMIITSTVHYGHIPQLWGLFAAGCALALAGLVGLFASWSLRPLWTSIFFWTMLFAWAGALAVLIINACFLESNMLGQCASAGAARFSQECEDRRDYHILLYTVFGPLVGLFVPTVLVKV